MNPHVRMGLIRKKPNWTMEAFRSYWRDRHGPLVARLPNLRAYWQNHVSDRQQRGIDYERGPWDFDGFSQLWFDDVLTAHHAFTDSDLAASFIADEGHFIGGLHILTVKQIEVIAVPQQPARGALLKRISTLRRRSDISEDEFRHEWRVHGELVRKMPGVSGYRQNVVVEREATKGKPCDHDELPIDGIVEMWFQSKAALEAAFRSPAGLATMAHARSFISEITAFLVEEHKAA